jgi:cold shock CspA family protein
MTANTERQFDTVKFWKENGGFGFVMTEDCREIFFHATQWVEEDSPRKGEHVSFGEDIGRDRRPFARQVMRASL